jgi:hypothetical protein
MPRSKTGRPAHEPTDATRQTVQMHTMVGTPQEIVADVLGIDSKTLRKHYRAELDMSKAKANAQVCGTLFKKCLAGDTTAMIFWMKTQAQWKETAVLEGSPDAPVVALWKIAEPPKG